MTTPEDSPKFSIGRVLAGVAFAAIALLIAIPAGLCTSAFGFAMLWGSINNGIIPWSSTIFWIVVCLPALIMCYFIIRTAIHIARG